MVSTTSGTTTWDLEIDEIIEEALERLGGESTSGQEARSARRSLNLLLIDMNNQGAALSSLEEISVTMVAGTTEYTLPQRVSAVLQRAVVNRDGTDYEIDKITLSDYLAIPTKTQTGRPVQYATDRQRDAVKLKVWFTPENSTDIIKMWCITRIEDIDASFQRVDLPYRYIPAITSGLAYFMSKKRSGVDGAYRLELKQDYMEQFQRALEEDRDRVDTVFYPSLTNPYI